MNKPFYSILLVVFALLPGYSAAELSLEEIACNRDLNDNKPKQAISKAEALLADNAKNANALTCLGRAYFALEQFDKAIDAFNTAESVGDHAYDKAFASLLAGHVYKNTDQLDKAVEAYQRSLNHAKAIQHQALILNNHMNIGHVQTLQKDYANALTAYQATFVLAANDNERGDTGASVAATQYALKNYDKAIEYQIKALLMFEKVGTLDQYAQALTHLTEYELAANRLNDADRYARKLIKFANDNGGAYYEAKGQLLLAKVKVAQSDTKAAKTLLTSASKLADKVQDPDLITEIKTYANGL